MLLAYKRMNETATALIAATQRCLERDGMAGATSRAITAEAGVNLGAITYHFGSKEQLVAEALVASLRTWLEPAVEVLRSEAEPVARTLLAVQTLVSTFEAHRDQVGLYLEALAQAPRIAPVGEAMIGLWRELQGLLTTQIAAMASDGQVGPWVDPHSMAALLVAVANGLVVQAAIDPDGPSVPAMAAQFSLLLLEAGPTQ